MLVNKVLAGKHSRQAPVEMVCLLCLVDLRPVLPPLA